MKQYLLIILISGVFASPTFAAICSCDAPPSCGSSRPPNCYQSESQLLLGKVYVEENTSGASKVLSFANTITAGVIGVSYGSPADGMPYGTYYAQIISNNQFNLMLKPYNGTFPQLIEKFKFEADLFSQQINLIEASSGSKFYLYKD